MNNQIITNPHDNATFNAQFDAPTWHAYAPVPDYEFPFNDEGIYADDASSLDIGQHDHAQPVAPPAPPENPQEPKKENPKATPVIIEYRDFLTPQIIDDVADKYPKSIIKAETGHGKTTATEGATGRAVLSMPMKDQCKQRQAKGDAFAVYEGVSVHDVPLDWQNIATTYNSLPRVLAVHKPDLLMIDEIPHWLTDAYRQRAIRDAYRAVRAFYGPIALMSATPLAEILTNTIFSDFQTIECRDVGTARPKRQIPIIAMDGGAIDHALDIARSGVVNGVTFPANGVVIVHMNDKTEIEAAIDYTNKLNIGTAYGFTADTKEKSHHKMMIKDGVLPDDCRFLYTTSLINDGFSFGPRANVVIVSRKSTLLPHECVQACARWRDGLDMALPHALIIFKREADEKPMNLTHNGLIFSQAVIREYKRLLEIAQNDLECAIGQREILNKRLNACADGGETAHVQKLIEKINAAYTSLTFKKDEIEIDHIAILQAATEANRHMATGQLIREIEEYDGFYFAGLGASKQEATEVVKEAKILLKTEERNDKSKQFANVLKVARNEGFGVVSGWLDYLKEWPDALPDGTVEALKVIATLWRPIEKRDGDFDKVLDTIEGLEITSKNKANKLAKRIRTSLIMANGAQLGQLANDEHASAKALQVLARLLPNGAALTDKKIEEISQAMGQIDGAEMVGRWGSKAKIIKSVKALFECRRQQKRNDDGKRVNFWRVDGVFDLSSICKSEASETPESEKVRHQQTTMF